MIDFANGSPIIDFIVSMSTATGHRSVSALPFVLFVCDMLVTNGLRIAFNHMPFIRPRPRMKSGGRPMRPPSNIL